MKHYDVAIIGAGPAGIFTAYHIWRSSPKARILLIEKGMDVQKRGCCGDCHRCLAKSRCSVLCGVGGSGLFSDGKLILDLHSGGKLDAVSVLTEQEKADLSEYIVRTLKSYDGLSVPGPALSSEKQREWQQIFHKYGLNIKHYDVLHMGTENLRNIISKFMKDMIKDSHIALRTNCGIKEVRDGKKGTSVLITEDGREFSAGNVVFSVGKTGSGWLKELFSSRQIEYIKNNVYIGVRLEASYESLKKLLEYSFDPKIWAFFQGRKVKTHCFCRHGEIICSNYMGFPVIGGHTRFTEKNQASPCKISGKSNFNILASIDMDKKRLLKIFEEFQAINGNGGVAQRLPDFLRDSSRKCLSSNFVLADRCKWGDVRTILDRIDSTGSIISDFIRCLGKVVPGVLSDNNVVYAPVLEWFMDSVKVDHHMETARKGWFAVGDGAGLSQGIVHAAATGIVAAEEICRRMEGEIQCSGNFI